MAPIVLALIASATTAFSQEGLETPEAGHRAIALTPSVSGASLFPLKNPGIVTLGTLSIQNRIDFAISASSTSNGNLAYSWNWGDGTPNGTGPFPNHTYIVAGIYNVTVTTTETIKGAVANTRTDTIVTTVTDAVKANKLQTNENWATASGNDSLRFQGTLHIPSGAKLAGQVVQISLGNLNLPFNPASLGTNDGVVFTFTLNDKGIATFTTNANAIYDPTTGSSPTTGTSALSQVSGKGQFKLAYRARAGGTAFVDAPFLLTLKAGTFAKALANEGVTNVDASRENVRITARVLAFNILYQSGINSLFSSTKGGKGKTR